MTWPRAFAISEALWSPKEKRNWTDFVGRVEKHFERLDAAQIKYAPSIYDPAFEITKKDNKTQLRFTQEGLVHAYECYNICSDAWSNYVRNSLHKLITTGKGEPNPKDQEDNFNSQLLEKYFDNKN